MSTKRILVITSAVVVLATLIVTASVAGAVYLGLRSAGTAKTTTLVPIVANTAGATGTTDLAAPSATVANGAAAMYIEPGVFQPGLQAPALNGDGVIVSGVAFKETADANAQPDAALVKSAFTDAQKRAQALAAAAGVKLGALLAVTDYTQNQPYYKPCAVPETGTPKDNGSSGSTGSGTSVGGSAAPAIAPAPAPVPACTPARYLVVWVTVRYQVGG